MLPSNTVSQGHVSRPVFRREGCRSPGHDVSHATIHPQSPAARSQQMLNVRSIFLVQIPQILFPSMIPEILLLIKQICPRTSQIDNLRTSIPVLLQPRTLKTVESV